MSNNTIEMNKTMNKDFFSRDFSPKVVPAKLKKKIQTVSNTMIPNLTIELQN